MLRQTETYYFQDLLGKLGTVANITDKGFVTSAIVNKEIIIKYGINGYVYMVVHSVLYCDGQMN